jgi:hypothetical protein
MWEQPSTSDGETWASVRQQFSEAFEAYMQTLQKAGVPWEAQRRIEQTYEEYTQAIQQAWAPQEIRDRAEETYREYLEALAEGLEPELVQKQFVEAYAAYVRALQAAWAGLDAEAMDPISLGAVAQSMLTVAWLANAGSSAMSDLADQSPANAAAEEELKETR